MKKTIWVVFVALCAVAQENRLPVKRVALYKNGVGYFEHQGQVVNQQQITIGFTAGQLNDVLKSLTVLDLGGGKVSGVTYGSKSPLDRQLGDLQLPLGEKTSLSELMGSLRGARVEIKTAAGAAVGRLLSIERKTRTGGGTTLEVDYLSLVSESGEVKTLELTSGYGVKFLDRDLAGKLDRYLNMLAATREADLRRMTIATTGNGARQLFVSYISEVPVWKTTYRLVLAKNAKPLVQGWAIVDNTVGEDWENVQLSLIAGAPQSFVQNLAQPYFARRPEIGLPQAYNPSPQTYEAAVRTGGARLTGTVLDGTGAGVGGVAVRAFDATGNAVGETRTNPSGRYEFGELPNGTLRLELSGAGFRTKRIENVQVAMGNPRQVDATVEVGEISEAVTVRGSLPELNTENASMAAVGSGRGRGAVRMVRPQVVAPMIAAAASVAPQVESQGLGDLYEYKLKEPVTIRKNQSAMVPIVQAPMEMEKVSVWSGGNVAPRRALWLHNTSDVTLDGGSFAVLEEATFAGEGVMEALRAGEKRLVSFAADLALATKLERQAEPERVTRVVAAKGVLRYESTAIEKTVYTLRNADAAARTVIVEHVQRPGFTLVGGVQPVETTANVARFRVMAPAKQTATLEVNEARALQQSYQVAEVGADQIRAWVSARRLTPAMQRELEAVMKQRAVVSALEDQESELDDENERIFSDQQRVRENLKAMKGSVEEKLLTQRYTQQLNAQEDRLEAIRKQVEDLRKRAAAEKVRLMDMVQAVTFDAAL